MQVKNHESNKEFATTFILRVNLVSKTTSTVNIYIDLLQVPVTVDVLLDASA